MLYDQIAHVCIRITARIQPACDLVDLITARSALSYITLLLTLLFTCLLAS